MKFQKEVFDCHTEVDWETPLIDLYVAYPWGDMWHEGQLLHVARYLRGSKRLNMPQEWRTVILDGAPDESMED